jgi:hypothetical protein
MGCCYCGEHAFFVSAESGVDPISEPRQTEPAAIGLALDYIDRGFSAVEIRDAGNGASFFEDFLLGYSAIRRGKK